MQDVTKQQTRVLRDLKTYTKYTISVYAENKGGLKGASAVTEATTKGGGIELYSLLLIVCLALQSSTSVDIPIYASTKYNKPQTKLQESTNNKPSPSFSKLSVSSFLHSCFFFSSKSSTHRFRTKAWQLRDRIDSDLEGPWSSQSQWKDHLLRHQVQESWNHRGEHNWKNWGEW